jgi:co-chaperonin GroES (HSP10)
VRALHGAQVQSASSVSGHVLGNCCEGRGLSTRRRLHHLHNTQLLSVYLLGAVCVQHATRNTSELVGEQSIWPQRRMGAMQVSQGGLILTANKTGAMDEAQLGEVVEVGSKVEIKVSKGDTIVYQKHGTTDIEASEGKVTFVYADSVLGVCA